MTVSQTQSIPTQDELEKVLGDDRVSDKKYDRYYKPYFEYLYSLPAGEVATDIELFDHAAGNYSRRTYREYLKHTIEYDPALELKVAGYVYHVDSFIEQNAVKNNITDIGKHINVVQQTCLNTYRESKTRYSERLIHYLRKETETEYSGFLNGMVDSDVVDRLLDTYEELLADRVPEKVTSMNQSGKNMAGSVNEELFLLALESAGLTRGSDFEQISSKGDTGDIKVYQKSGGNPFRIEAKSSKNRERGEFGVGAVDSPSGLLGFFDDAEEIVGAAGKLDNECRVVYLPPGTLADIARSDHSVYSMTSQKTGQRFLRANNEYGVDMKHYHAHGDLPDKPLGHEGKYLTATWGK
ncbi:hypothetical protein [Haloferax sulfurifontis]|uniref:Uncharacterized protein n=1 Tax=Haloferax sulfurifontis ATCC BAA-897 TaxID=662480 RepID=M0I6T1_9EURY|nr:hypothetical protein [Haloferax sulfurifontis]ELZ91149.1 hypothetical protein C441_12480 [Haloferax sulfurifontis ATCC BAA-897]